MDARREALAQHRRNLAELELQAAVYGTTPPIHLVNQIKFEKAEIEQLEQQLAAEPEQVLTTPVATDDIDEMTEARIVSAESTLQRMEQKFEKLDDGLRSVQTRLTALEVRFEEVQREVHQVRREIEMMRSGVSLPKGWTLAAGIILVVMLGLLIYLSWSAR